MVASCGPAQRHPSRVMLGGTGFVTVTRTRMRGEQRMAENDQVAAIAQSRAEWASLRRRLETVTPATLARAGLTVGAGLGMLAVAVGTWPALMPFLVGAVIAYSVLPLVNRLDGILPRGLAALLSVLAVVGLLVAIVAIVLPPLVASVGQLATTLPGR